MAKIIIIFGSTGGNTELACEKVAEVLESKKHKVTLQRAELSDVKDIKGHDLSILASPTYGHGMLQEHMIPIHYHLSQSQMPGQKFAIIALGDDKYDMLYHIEAANHLRRAIEKCGGEVIFKPLKINKSPVPQLETIIKYWAEDLAKKL